MPWKSAEAVESIEETLKIPYKQVAPTNPVKRVSDSNPVIVNFCLYPIVSRDAF